MSTITITESWANATGRDNTIKGRTFEVVDCTQHIIAGSQHTYYTVSTDTGPWVVSAQRVESKT